MALSVEQFLSLPQGARVLVMGRACTIQGTETNNGREEPVLINEETNEPVHGAIYVAHMMNMHPAFIAEREAQKAQDEMMLGIDELGEPEQDEFYCSELITGRPDTPEIQA